jgi:hypothetical protein
MIGTALRQACSVVIAGLLPQRQRGAIAFLFSDVGAVSTVHWMYYRDGKQTAHQSTAEPPRGTMGSIAADSASPNVPKNSRGTNNAEGAHHQLALA